MSTYVGHSLAAQPPKPVQQQQPQLSPFIQMSGQNLIYSGKKIQLVGINWGLTTGCYAPETSWAASNASTQFGTFHPRAWYRLWMIPGNGDLVTFDKIVAAAEAAGVFLTVVLADADNQCGQSFTMDQTMVDTINAIGLGHLNVGSSGGTANQVATYVQWINTVVTRVSSITGRAMFNSPAIGWWEIMNENGSVLVKGSAFYNIVGTYIKSLDPNHLVGSGCNGAYALDANNGGTQAQLTACHTGTGIDLVSVHEYDGWSLGEGITSSGNVNGDQTSGWFTVALNAANALNKPVYVGEFGTPGTVLENSTVITTDFVNTKYKAYLGYAACATVAIWQLINSASGFPYPFIAISTANGASQVFVDCWNAIKNIVSPNNGG